MPPNPRAAALRSVSTGKISRSSHSRANGIMCSRANERATAWNARCSSVSSKSIRRPLLPEQSCQPIMARNGPGGARLSERLKHQESRSGDANMAIKFGRPIESRSRFAPVEPKSRSGSGADLELTSRPRRNRRTEWLRRLVREHALTTDDLIWPLFLVEGASLRVPVESMPGVERLSVDEAVREADR